MTLILHFTYKCLQMTPNLGGWIHNFTVTETQTHKGGYTIYKITSIVFPLSIPQALTCLTIWKRFHDVKRLHRELLRRHRSLKLPGQLPEPTDCSFFKRFDPDVICDRKEYILQLLDFAAQHPALYKSYAFTQFFNEAQQTGNFTPTLNASPLQCLHATKNLKGGVIADICDKLDLRYDPHDVSLSITLLEHAADKSETKEKLRIINDGIASNSDEIVSAGTGENIQEATLRDKKTCKDYTRFLTPMASIESDDSDYIYEAALEFSRAVQAEVNLEYSVAHMHYKHGVEVLLSGSKDDSNDERKFIAKAKISKYLARSDDIYDKFLCNHSSNIGGVDSKHFQLSLDVSGCSIDGQSVLYLERPWNHLAKYKVLQVLGERVMQVHCVTEPEPRTTYVMKGIEKPSSNMPTQRIFLPQQVPYMVELLAFFQSEQKIFLLLKQAEGGHLYDYITSYRPTPVTRTADDFAALFPDEIDAHTSALASAPPVKADSSGSHKVLRSQDSGYVDQNITSDLVESNSSTRFSPSESAEFSELVRCSQQLLKSVSKTLQQSQQLDDESIQMDKMVEVVGKAVPLAVISSPKNQFVKCRTKLPEASLKQWARELAVAVHSLHGKGVILSDLNMDNLLLGAKGQLLLTYFYQNEGLNGVDHFIHKAYSPTAVAGHYVAPERPLTFKSDWWSYGVILYQLLLGLPFLSAHPGNIDLYGLVQYPENVELSESARDLLDHLLQQAPEARFDYEQIQAHAFFEGTNWGDLYCNGLYCANNCKDTGIC